MRKIGFVLALGSIFLMLPVRAEEIELKDGNKVTGKVIAVTDDAFQIKTAYGTISVPRSDIVSISFPENRQKTNGEGKTQPAATPVDESLHGTTYTNRTAKFEVTVPPGWMTSEDLRRQSKDIIAGLVSPDGTLFFFVTPEEFAGTLATYRVLAETQFQATFKDYEKMSESEARLDGKTGVRLIWRGKNPSANDAPLKYVVYIIPYDGRFVRLTFLTLEPLFADALPIFEKIATSYRSITP